VVKVFFVLDGTPQLLSEDVIHGAPPAIHETEHAECLYMPMTLPVKPAYPEAAKPMPAGAI